MLPALVSVYPFSICSFLGYTGLSNTNLFGPEVILLFRLLGNSTQGKLEVKWGPEY